MPQIYVYKNLNFNENLSHIHFLPTVCLRLMMPPQNSVPFLHSASFGYSYILCKFFELGIFSNKIISTIHLDLTYTGCVIYTSVNLTKPT